MWPQDFVFKTERPSMRCLKETCHFRRFVVYCLYEVNVLQWSPGREYPQANMDENMHRVLLFLTRRWNVRPHTTRIAVGVCRVTRAAWMGDLIKPIWIVAQRNITFCCRPSSVTLLHIGPATCIYDTNRTRGGYMSIFNTFILRVWPKLFKSCTTFS